MRRDSSLWRAAPHYLPPAYDAFQASLVDNDHYTLSDTLSDATHALTLFRLDPLMIAFPHTRVAVFIVHLIARCFFVRLSTL